MNYTDFEEFKDLGKTSRMIPVFMEMEGGMETPVTLFKKLCRDKNGYLLESLESGNKCGRYSYIGRNPFITVRSYGNRVVVHQRDKTYVKSGSVLGIVKSLINDYKTPRISDMPDFTGGAVGYIGYDVTRNHEHLGNTNLDDMEMPEVNLMLTEEVIVFDHARQKIKMVVNMPVSGDIKASYKRAVERLHSLGKEISESHYSMKQDKGRGWKRLIYSSNETKEDYMQKVLRAKEYIKNGDIYQVVLSQRLQVETEANPFRVYRTLRDINPSPYMYYIDFGEYQLVGSSPELLVKVKENIVETCPIAGTRPRGQNPVEDEKYAEELLKDGKELAEHLMLVDLARNDIGKISKFGTVTVNPFMDIQKYSHVMHIVSNVTGEIRPDCDMFDALISCLPAGTVSGAPKIRAMEIIDQLENRKRGVYAGAVGYLGFNGNLDTCIAIRTIIFKDGTAYMQAGAGIVADSRPENEYYETLNKAQALIEAIRKTEEDIS